MPKGKKKKKKGATPVKTDNKKIEDLKKAAEEGHVASQRDLAQLYYDGKGTTKDLNAAFSWWDKAAAEGDAEALCNLGVCYDNGDGVKQDREKAVECYRAAASKGHADAQ